MEFKADSTEAKLARSFESKVNKHQKIIKRMAKSHTGRMELLAMEIAMRKSMFPETGGYLETLIRVDLTNLPADSRALTEN